MKDSGKLVRQADDLLFGRSRNMHEAKSLREKNLGVGIKEYPKKGYELGQCIVCGGVRYSGGAGRCRACYIAGAKSSTQEKKIGARWITDMQSGIDDKGSGDEGMERSEFVRIDYRDPLSILIEREDDDE